MLEDRSRALARPCVVIEAGENPTVKELLAFAGEIDAIFLDGEDECIVLRDRNGPHTTTKLIRVKAFQELDDYDDFHWSLAKHIIKLG